MGNAAAVRRKSAEPSPEVYLTSGEQRSSQSSSGGHRSSQSSRDASTVARQRSSGAAYRGVAVPVGHAGEAADSHEPAPAAVVARPAPQHNSQPAQMSAVERAVSAAHREVEAILSEQVAVCRRWWERLAEELAIEEALWESAAPGEASEHARALLRAAGAVQDVAQISEALAHAERSGLEVSSSSLRGTLNALREEEDREALWRCLTSALQNVDRVDVQFWSAEAENQGLIVPEAVHIALHAVQAEECAMLQELEERMSIFQAKVNDARERGDGPALQDLIAKAKRAGLDVSSAVDALNAISAERGSRSAAGDLAGGSARQTSGGDDGAGPAPTATTGTARTSEQSASADQRNVYRSATAFPARTAGMPTTPDAEAGSTTESAGRDAGSSRTSGDHAAGAGSTSADHGAGIGSPGSERTARSNSHGPAGSAGTSPSRPPPPPPQQPGQSRHTSSGNGQAAAIQVPLTRQSALACLGLPPTGFATADELRQAYKRAALRWHPDRRHNHSQPEEATRRFQEARSAFDYLQARSWPTLHAV